jgi:hypothetical protein
MPTRLIDVGGEPTSTLRLVTLDTRADYLALSYCWGKVYLLKERFATTQANIASRCSEGMPLSILPATLRDACLVTRALGRRYIWIDSIFIIQDSPADWAAESCLMSDIYAHAFLTIVATSSSSVFDGMSLSRPESYSIELDMQVRVRDGPDLLPPGAGASLLWAHPAMGRTRDLMGCDQWIKRGWTLQERLLSRRVLHLTARLLYAECREHGGAESTLYETQPSLP